MKQLYLILSIIFGLLILLFVYLHITYIPITIDRKIHDKTISLIKTTQKNPVSINTNENLESITPNIWEDNLFDPLRGNLAGTVSSPKSNEEITDMELIGICNTPILKGAIILQKKNSYRSLSSLRSKSKNKTETQTAPQKRFFRIDERLPSGYVLEEVNTDSVTLRRGNEQITLKLKFDDNNSGNRVSSDAASSVKAQLEKIREQKNKLMQRAQNRTSVKVTPNEENKEENNEKNKEEEY